jgi:hypothetical protein
MQMAKIAGVGATRWRMPLFPILLIRPLVASQLGLQYSDVIIAGLQGLIGFAGPRDQQTITKSCPEF